MKQDNALGYHFRILHNLSNWHADIAMEREGLSDLTGIHGWVARYLLTTEKEVVLQKDLEESLYMQSSAMSRVLTLMETNGYITRERYPKDKRARMIRPTAKLTKTYPKIREELQRVEALMIKGLSREEMSQFLTTLKQIEYNLCGEFFDIKNPER